LDGFILKINIKKRFPFIEIDKETIHMSESSDWKEGQWGNFPSGHFYSTIPTSQEVQSGLIKSDSSIKNLIRDLKLSDFQMLNLGKKILDIGQNYSNAVFSDSTISDPRKALAFSPRDSLVLYSMLEIFKPNKVIEIGAGESTTTILDSIKMNELNTKVISIEPYPEFLLGKITKRKFKNFELISKKVQDTNLDLYKSLKANDILFIDSTHVVKIGSDVNFIFENILPTLEKGVIVHVHDIIWPFEYHETWLTSKIYWNEAYFLRALLSNSDRYEVIWFGSYFEKYLLGKYFVNIPKLFMLGDSGSIYFKVK
jgi:predicted O-methyltransferase YrrM